MADQNPAAEFGGHPAQVEAADPSAEFGGHPAQPAAAPADPSAEFGGHPAAPNPAAEFGGHPAAPQAAPSAKPAEGPDSEAGLRESNTVTPAEIEERAKKYPGANVALIKEVTPF